MTLPNRTSNPSAEHHSSDLLRELRRLEADCPVDPQSAAYAPIQHRIEALRGRVYGSATPAACRR